MPSVEVITAEVCRYWAVTDDSRGQLHARAFRTWVSSACFAARLSGDVASALMPYGSGWRNWQYGKRVYSGCSLEDVIPTWTVQSVTTVDPRYRDFEEKFAPVAGAIDDLEARPVGWDSYGALRIREAARTLAKRVLQLAFTCSPNGPVPTIAGTPDGGVVLEWFGPEFECSIGVRDLNLEVFVARIPTDQVIRDIELDFDRVGEAVATVLPFMGR